MRDTVRFGMVGCGMISDTHAQGIRAAAHAELVGCCSASTASASRFATRYGIERFDSLEALLASDRIDAVCICTPSGLHTPQAIAALSAGKHVVLEKPMSLTLDEADRLIAAAAETGRKVAVISQLRHQGAVQAAKGAIDAGALGRITSASLSMKYFRSREYYASAGWRGTWAMDGGGALMNQGIHGVDVFRHLMGPVTWLYGTTDTLVHSIEVEDTAAAVIGFRSGAVGTLDGSTACYPGFPRRIEICGDQGSITLEEDAILRWDLDIPCPLPVGQRAQGVGSSNPSAITIEGHTRQLQNLVDAVLFDTPLLLDAAAARPTLEIILGIYESSRTGATLRIEQEP